MLTRGWGWILPYDANWQVVRKGSGNLLGGLIITVLANENLGNRVFS
jgi:hypothetical protein